MKRNPLTESIDALIREQRAEPFHRYIFTRQGLADVAAATGVVAVSMLLGGFAVWSILQSTR